MDFFFGFQQSFFLLGISRFPGILQDLLCGFFRRTDFAFCYVFTSQISSTNA